tara:strand:+ start:2669 stop:3043 length:375 start_codon:yes stop_codon:yes gene_type:complete
MVFYPASSSSPRQLSLDLDLEDVPSAYLADSAVKRSVIFPKNIQIFNVPEFQRQVSQLFDPLNIDIEFRVTRQNRLEMRWSFPQEAIQYNHSDARSEPHQPARLSPEENAAFETLVLSFAGSSH